VRDRDNESLEVEATGLQRRRAVNRTDIEAEMERNAMNTKFDIGEHVAWNPSQVV